MRGMRWWWREGVMMEVDYGVKRCADDCLAMAGVVGWEDKKRKREMSVSAKRITILLTTLWVPHSAIAGWLP